MKIKVRIFMDNKLIKKSEICNVSIKNPSVDRIVNEIVKRNNQVGMNLSD